MAQSLESGTDIRVVRQLLDTALLGLRNISDSNVDRLAVERDIGDSLAHCYEALSSSGSYERFRNHTAAALDLARAAMNRLVEYQTDDPEVDENRQLLMRALTELSNVRIVASDDAPPIPRADGVLRATTGRLTLLRLPRHAIRPTVPLDALEKEEPVADPKIEPIAPAASIDAVKEMMEQARKAMEQMNAGDDGNEEQKPAGDDPQSEDEPPKVFAIGEEEQEKRETAPGASTERETSPDESSRETSLNLDVVEEERATSPSVLGIMPAREEQTLPFGIPGGEDRLSDFQISRQPIQPPAALSERPPPARSTKEFDRRVTQVHLSDLPARLSDVHAQRFPSVRPSVDLDRADAYEVTLFGEIHAEDALMTARSEELLLELGAMGRMRRPAPELTWLHALETERRLLTRIDALVACGEWTFPHLVRLLADRPVSDPDLIWALIVLLGCIDGSDSMDQIRRILDVIDLAEEEVDIVETVADAFFSIPHPGTNDLLTHYVRDPMPERRRVAVEALGARRAFAPEQLVAMTQDEDEEVVLAAVRGITLLSSWPSSPALSALFHHNREDIQRGMIAASLVHRKRRGFDRAIEMCETGDPDRADSAMFVAIAGRREEAFPILMERGATGDAPIVLRALGWLGDPRAIEFLVGRLESETDGVAEAAASALERITGARLLKDDPDPEYTEGDEPFRRQEGLRIDIPAEVACLDAEAWRAFWKKRRSGCDLDKRYRFGHAWLPSDTFAEMSEKFVTIEERFYLHLELTVRTAGTIPLDAHAFADRQLSLHDMWPGHLHRIESKPGEYSQHLE